MASHGHHTQRAWTSLLYTVLALLPLGTAINPTPASAQDERAPATTDSAVAAPGLGVTIDPGSGSFAVSGGGRHSERTIRVFYHRPASFHQGSPVVVVIPGAGRNADDYRDAWVEASERHGALVLSPHYPERFYPEYWSYNLAGMTSSVTLAIEARIDTDPEQWRLDDAAAGLDSALTVHPHELFGHGSFGQLLRQIVLFHSAETVTDVDVRATGLEVNPDEEKWIFGDFDRIFSIARQTLDLEAETYDLFGHSAGGQILHRLALFRPGSKADRILAANSGWYTLPSLDTAFPYGLADTPTNEEQLAEALGAKLVIFLGEKDNAEETRGSLRSTPEAAEQGPGRLSRGRYFYEKGREAAGRLGVDLGWKLYVVPGVGHDYERMSAAAAEYLWGAKAEGERMGPMR